MKNRGIRKRTVLLFVLVFMLTLFMAATPILAATDTAPVTYNSGVTPDVSSGGIQIVEYKAFIGENTLITDLRKGDHFTLDITLRDDRTELFSASSSSTSTSSKSLPSPVARLNTASFLRSGGNADSSLEGAVKSDDPTTYITYTLRFQLKYLGVGNTFQCEVFYSNRPNVPMQTVTLSLNQCVEYVEPESSSSSSEAETRGTGFVLKNASYGANQIDAGKQFTLEAALLATNGSYAVENTSVTLVLPKEITFATGSSVFYAGTVKPNATVNVSFDLFPSAAAEEGSYVITIKITGVSAKDGTTVEASADITVPIVQPERFEIGNASVPEYVMVGMADGYASIDLVNKGKGSVFNVEAEVVGDGISTEGGKQFIGTIAGGSSSSVDFMIIATMGGELSGQVVITYENSQGMVKTLTHDFTMMAEEMMMPEPGEGMEPMPGDPGFDDGSGGLPVWVWFLVAVVVVGGVIVAIVIIGKKKKAAKKAQEEADLDDDFDDFPPPSAPDVTQVAAPQSPPQNPEGT